MCCGSKVKCLLQIIVVRGERGRKKTGGGLRRVWGMDYKNQHFGVRA